MNLTKGVLVSGLVAASSVLMTIDSAIAANLVNSWHVVEAKSSEYNGSGGHAFWLPEMVEGGKFVFDGDAYFKEYSDGTAHFTGSIVAKKDANKTWDFDIWFESRDEVGSGGPKKELNSSAYVENGGTVDTSTWSYYDFSSTKKSILTADSGKYAGDTIELYDFTKGKYPMQIGMGASGKNTKMGFSTWFGYKGDKNSTKHADINVNLIPKSVPEPMTGALSLAIFGATTILGIKRKQK